MGTRGLTAVYFDGAYRIAQYGQWDHYPEGQGVTALSFCRKWLANTRSKRFTQFIANLMNCRYVSNEEMKAAMDRAKRAVPSRERMPDGLVTFEQVHEFEKTFPLINRDHGAKILELVAEGEGGLEIQDELPFAADSVFCEYAYVIDLDKRTLEVYRGFNEKPLPEGERFHNMPLHQYPGHTSTTYYPVRHWKTFSLDKLPTKRQFLKDLTEPEEDEDYEDDSESDTQSAAV